MKLSRKTYTSDEVRKFQEECEKENPGCGLVLFHQVSENKFKLIKSIF
jgi:hypothetical protein